MANLNPNNPFASYILSPQEIIEGSKLSLLQTQCIQNIIASYATERISREISTSNPIETAIEDAKNKGQIEALLHILDLSAAASASPSSPQEA